MIGLEKIGFNIVLRLLKNGHTVVAIDRNATQIFAGMVSVTIDDAGRIVLPPVTKRLRKLENHAFFIGLGDRFEIWDPWIYLAAEDADEVAVEQLREELLLKKLPLDGPPAA